MWMSVVPPLPALALSLLIEGPGRIAASFDGLGERTGLLALLGLVYTVVLATLLGSGIWSWLMARHPAGSVAPFSMLVPVVGMSTAALVLGERTAPLELLGGALVVGGVLWATWRPRGRRGAAALAPEALAPEPLTGARSDAPPGSTPARAASEPTRPRGAHRPARR
jgi:O-acetylserine/cysteine efflux transporter